MPAIARFLDTINQHRLAPLLALVLGLITPFSLAPYHLWPVAILSSALLIELLRNQSAKAAAWRGFCYGFGLWAYGSSWLYVSIHDYGYTPAWLAIPMVGILAAVMALFFAALGFVYGRFNLSRWSLLAFPALFVFGEWLRSWVLTGFPWLFNGYAFTDTWLAGFAPVLGIFGVTLFALISSAALITLLREGQKRWPLAALIVLIWASGFALQQQSFTQVKDTAFSVSIVQGNIPQESKWQLEWRDKTIDIYRSLSESEWGRDLVIWPEAALPMFMHEALPLLTDINQQAEQAGSAFVTGVPYADLNENRRKMDFYNSIIALGLGNGIYHKQRLVPFGEYIPLEGLLRGAMPFFDLPMSSFSWGGPNQMPLVVKDFLLSPSICYEIAYPDLVRRNAANAEILTTITNDGWFGHSIGPHQHFQMVRMRAIETGRQIIRATNNGISAIINEKGEVTARAPQFERLVLRADVYPTTGKTPYVAFGNWPVLLLSLSMLALAFTLKARKSSI